MSVVATIDQLEANQVLVSRTKVTAQRCNIMASNSWASGHQMRSRSHLALRVGLLLRRDRGIFENELLDMPSPAIACVKRCVRGRRSGRLSAAHTTPEAGPRFARDPASFSRLTGRRVADRFTLGGGLPQR